MYFKTFLAYRVQYPGHGTNTTLFNAATIEQPRGVAELEWEIAEHSNWFKPLGSIEGRRSNELGVVTNRLSASDLSDLNARAVGVPKRIGHLHPCFGRPPQEFEVFEGIVEAIERHMEQRHTEGLGKPLLALTGVELTAEKIAETIRVLEKGQTHNIIVLAHVSEIILLTGTGDILARHGTTFLQLEVSRAAGQQGLALDVTVAPLEPVEDHTPSSDDSQGWLWCHRHAIEKKQLAIGDVI